MPDERASTALARAEPEQVSGLVRLALEQGVAVDVLRDLVALQERVSDRQARAAFFAAFAAFKAELPPIPKTGGIDRKVERDGSVTYRSRFAPLPVIAEVIREPLARHGFAYWWSSEVDGSGVCTVRCHVHHIEGHSIVSEFRFREQDAKAPGMSGVQASGSARSYGERYSLIQALGLTTADVDDDGGPPEEREPVSVEQEANLAALVREVFGDDEPRLAAFLGHVGKVNRCEVNSLAEIPADAYRQALGWLEDKRRAAS
jgi:hypothetical protein